MVELVDAVGAFVGSAGSDWSGADGGGCRGSAERPRRVGADPQRLFASGHVAGVRSFRSLHDLELDRLAFFECAETVALNRREVHEEVAAAFTLDERK